MAVCAVCFAWLCTLLFSHLLNERRILFYFFSYAKLKSNIKKRTHAHQILLYLLTLTGPEARYCLQHINIKCVSNRDCSDSFFVSACMSVLLFLFNSFYNCSYTAQRRYNINKLNTEYTCLFGVWLVTQLNGFSGNHLFFSFVFSLACVVPSRVRFAWND